jgi:hypothetical protein
MVTTSPNSPVLSIAINIAKETADEVLQNSIGLIDNTFGRDYAKKNPTLLATVITNQVSIIASTVSTTK